MGLWIDIIILQNWSFMQLFCILKQQNTIPGMMWTQIIFVLQHHLLLSCFCTLTEKRNFKLVWPVPKDLKDKPTCLKSRNGLNITDLFSDKLRKWPPDLIVWCCRCSLVVSPPTASSSWSSPSSRWISIFAPDLFVSVFDFLFSLPLSNRLDFITFYSASPEDRRLRPSCKPRCSSDRWLQPIFISKINLETIKVTGAYFPNKVDISKYQGSVNTAIAFYLTPSARADTPRKIVLFFLDDTRTPFYAACVAIRAAGTSGHTFCRISAILPRRICVRRIFKDGSTYRLSSLNKICFQC